MAKGLGRLFIPDERDRDYPMRALLRKRPALTWRYWNANGWWGDQGLTSQCVAYAWAHWLEDGPVTHKGKAPVVKPSVLYAEAQRVDQWPGEDYDGTSVRAGAKVLRSEGWIESYHWARGIGDVVECLLSFGPVVVGTNWYEGMFDPSDSGLIRVEGVIAGGHAYLLDGVNVDEETVRVKNSWGRDWGRRGFASLRFSDLERLIDEDGEACVAVEAKR